MVIRTSAEWNTAADAPIGNGDASPIRAISEVLDQPAARGGLADVVDAPGLASRRLFDRDFSAAHLSAAIEGLAKRAA
jgi:hypothetical protein